MSLKLGDKVRFVNENMQGVVTSLNGKIAGVTIEDDFEIPVAINEVVKIAEDAPAKEEKASGITQKTRFVKVYEGIHIAFERINETLLDLKFHNSESDLIAYAYHQKKTNNTFELVKNGELLKLSTHVSLGRFDLEKFNTWPEMAFQVMHINEKAKIRSNLSW
jgi:hypothetical protein